MKVLRDLTDPSRKERELHGVVWVDWRKNYVRGRRRKSLHRRSRKGRIEITGPAMCLNYCFQKGRTRSTSDFQDSVIQIMITEHLPKRNCIQRKTKDRDYKICRLFGSDCKSWIMTELSWNTMTREVRIEHCDDGVEGESYSWQEHNPGTVLVRPSKVIRSRRNEDSQEKHRGEGRGISVADVGTMLTRFRMDADGLAFCGETEREVFCGRQCAVQTEWRCFEQRWLAQMCVASFQGVTISERFRASVLWLFALRLDGSAVLLLDAVAVQLPSDMYVDDPDSRDGFQWRDVIWRLQSTSD